MKKTFWLLALLMALVLPMQNVLAEEAVEPTPYFPAEYAAEFEQASAALQAHLPGALVDFAVRERDDGRYEWDLFFVLDGQLGEVEILEGDFAIRRVRLYDMPEGGLTALQAIAVLAQEKGELLVTDLELDLDDGRLRYEGEAMLGERHYEFEISATGSIIEWEYD